MEPRASIVLLTHNGGPDLDRVLDGVYAQEGVSFEVIAIDTESTDGTLERLQQRPLRLERISKREFSHPGTRNRGVRLARGEIIVFLVQDAIPHHRRWLANLLAPLDENPRVAAAYSRQIPREGCNPVEHHDIELGAPPVRRVKQIDLSDPLLRRDWEKHLGEFIMFSNVSSCARRQLLVEHPFDESILMCEDQAWCKRILEAGYRVVYEPSSVVMHSHDHSVQQIYRRHMEYGQSFARFLPRKASLTGAIIEATQQTLSDYVWLAKADQRLSWKLAWMPQIPLRRLAMTLGVRRGLLDENRPR